MNGLSVVILVAAFGVLVAGLFAVIVERTNERDQAEREVDRLERELEGRLTNPATATTVRIPSMTRHLSLVQSDDDWFAELYDENGNHR